MKGNRKGQSLADSSTVTLTLSTSVAQDLYQALTIALGGSGGKKTAAAAKTRRVGKGKGGYGGAARAGKTTPRKGKR